MRDTGGFCFLRWICSRLRFFSTEAGAAEEVAMLIDDSVVKRHSLATAWRRIPAYSKSFLHLIFLFWLLIFLICYDIIYSAVLKSIKSGYRSKMRPTRRASGFIQERKENSWLSANSAESALFTDSRCPTQTARQTEHGSPTSEKSKSFRAVHTERRMFAPVACVQVR